MRFYRFFYAVALTAAFSGCGDEQVILNEDDQQTFKGSFQVLKHKIKVDDFGKITLNIEDGRYYGTVNQAFGNFAGKLEITAYTINFIDTLFIILPANILPPRVPRGEYDYTFDGETLKFGNKLESGGTERYNLNLQD